MTEKIKGLRQASRAMITVGLVVYNREWIIGKMLDSLLSQNYPHDNIYIVVVDGGSEDSTVEIIKDKLENSDFSSYEIIVEKCNIPEGRNICIERARGDVLVFWDSDVIMGSDALSKLVEPITEEKADIVFAEQISIYLNSSDELDKKIKTLVLNGKETKCVDTPSVGMGCTAVSKRVFESLHFDEDLTYSEDLYFSAMARMINFKMVKNRGVRAYDINLMKRKYSDIFVDMPLKYHLRGLRKKAEAHVLTCDFNVTFEAFLKFFMRNKRYAFYLGYIPVAIVTVYSFLSGQLLVLLLPTYIVLYLALQVRKRGFLKAVKAFLRSIIVGIPFSILLVYYFIKHATANKSHRNGSFRELK